MKGTIIITMVFVACFVLFFVFQLLETFCVMCWSKFPEALTVFEIVALLLVLSIRWLIHIFTLTVCRNICKPSNIFGKKLLCRRSNVNPGE